MQICLISGNEATCAFFADLIGEKLSIVAAGSELPPAEIYVWDVDPNGPVPSPVQDAVAKNLFLVTHSDLERFDKALPGATAVILKPLNRGVVSAFCQAGDARVRTFAKQDQLRADRDALLQFVLDANLRLQRHEEERTNFLSRALHDFRAPLTALRGYCEMLLDGRLGFLTAAQDELLRGMLRSVRRLSGLAAGMYRLSVEGRAPSNLKLEYGDIESCVEQAIHELTPFISEKDINVSVELEPSVEALRFDQEQIEQVFVNLVENSCKFTQQSGEIRIHGYSTHWDFPGSKPSSASQRPNAYRIDLSDSGPGVDATHVASIFEQYTSYSGPKDRSGGGLGLAICRGIIEAHGGVIWAEPSAGGARFVFVLPFLASRKSASSEAGFEKAANGLARVWK